MLGGAIVAPFQIGLGVKSSPSLMVRGAARGGWDQRYVKQ